MKHEFIVSEVRVPYFNLFIDESRFGSYEEAVERLAVVAAICREEGMRGCPAYVCRLGDLENVKNILMAAAAKDAEAALNQLQYNTRSSSAEEGGYSITWQFYRDREAPIFVVDRVWGPQRPRRVVSVEQGNSIIVAYRS